MDIFEDNTILTSGLTAWRGIVKISCNIAIAYTTYTIIPEKLNII